MVVDGYALSAVDRGRGESKGSSWTSVHGNGLGADLRSWQIHSQFNLSQILVDSTAFLGTVSGGAAAHELPRTRSVVADSLQLLNIAAFA